MAPIVLGLLLLAPAGLAQAAAGAPGQPAGPPYLPGDGRYWTALRSLEVNEGVMEPRFDPDGTHFRVRIDRAYPKTLVLALGLRLEMYNIMKCPRISVDGRNIEYSPLDVIEVLVPLNETHGPEDKTVQITVADPNPGNWLSPTNWHTYKLHVIQPPDFGRIVQAQAITVRDGRGREVASHPGFAPGSPVVSYHYVLAEGEAGADVRLECSPLATAMMYNGRRVERGAVLHVDLAPGGARARALAECAYRAPRWMQHEARRAYMLTFSRAAQLDHMSLDLMMLPDFGFCLTPAEYARRLGNESGGRDPSQEPGGFVCLSDKPRPLLMASYNRSDAEVTLERDGEIVLLQSFLPAAARHGAGREAWLLRARAGEDEHTYPVAMIWPASCSTLHCPEHHVARQPGVRELALVAEAHVCLAEECSERDVPHCCEPLAKCSSLACPSGKRPAKGTEATDCAAGACGPRDVPRCCEDRAACSSYACPHGMGQRGDAATTYCDGPTCIEEDEPRCCKALAPCSSFTCPAGKLMSGIATTRFCQASVCGERDEPHCCESPAKCNTLTCPAGLALRARAGSLDCYSTACGEEDAATCCEKDERGVHHEAGTVERINGDGTYAINYDSGEADRHVPEWALRGGEDHSNLRPGDRISVSKAKDGYHHHRYCFGWVQEAHSDGTYAVRYDDGEVDPHAPGWALREIDDLGRIFVHSELLVEGERVIASKTREGYQKEEYVVGTVTKVNSDGTYTVRNADGQEERHVPEWDVRAIDEEGRSYATDVHRVGEEVEVNLGAKEEYSQMVEDQMRTKFLLGYVRKAKADGTYTISYDFGGTEDNVPGWAIRALDKNLHSSAKRKYEPGARIEARISMNTANNLTGWGIEALGIATREKVAYLRTQNCWPEAQECGPKPPKETPHKHKSPPMVPTPPTYDVVNNPLGLKLCFYDRSCSQGDLPGCNVGGDRPNCRYCGFEPYPPCHKRHDCSSGFPGAWPREQRDWCCAHYNVGCPYECRWGKWWPDEANGWGPWWTEEKRKWCCAKQHIGCPHAEDGLYKVRPDAAPAAAARPRGDAGGMTYKYEGGLRVPRSGRAATGAASLSSLLACLAVGAPLTALALAWLRNVRSGSSLPRTAEEPGSRELAPLVC